MTWPVYLPIYTQHLKGTFTQKGVAVLMSLTLPDPDQHPFAVNVFHPKAKCLSLI